MKNIVSPSFGISGSFARIAAAACVLAALLGGCAAPMPTGQRDVISSGLSPAKPSAAAGPRFAQGGPDAEDYGVSQSYPIGDSATCPRPAFLVGCHSHFDQVYEGRLVRRATTSSPLARAVSEPAIRYEYQGQTFTLDDYLRATPPPGSSLPVVTRSSLSAISTRGTTATVSCRGRWPRR